MLGIMTPLVALFGYRCNKIMFLLSLQANWSIAHRYVSLCGVCEYCVIVLCYYVECVYVMSLLYVEYVSVVSLLCVTMWNMCILIYC